MPSLKGFGTLCFSKALLSLRSALTARIRRFLMWVLSAGPIPNHLAIIMDGNRRFADRHGLDRRSGHAFGYESLLNTLKDCLDLGIRVVTVYAFSIDNFKRSPTEVSALMDLMQEKFETLAEKEPLLTSYGVRVCVLGNLYLLPENVRIAAERAMTVTRSNNFAVLNICIAYTSTQEIVHSVESIRDEFISKLNEFQEENQPLAIFPSVDVRNAEQGWTCYEHDLRDCSTSPTRNSTLRRRSRVEERLSACLCNGSPQLDTELPNGYPKSGAQLVNGCSNVYEPLFVGDDDFWKSSTRHLHLNLSLSAFPEKKLENGQAFTMIDTKTIKVCAKHNPAGDDWPKSALQVCRKEKVPGSACRKTNKENGEVANSSDLLDAVLDTVTAEMIEHHLYSFSDPPPDLLLRTSGETRLSNFLLWQSSFSHLSFCKVLWPEFSFRHLFWIILEYQRDFPYLIENRRLHAQISSRSCKDLGDSLHESNSLPISCRKLEIGGSYIIHES